MTEEQLWQVRIVSRLLVNQWAVESLYKMLAAASPDVAQALRMKAAEIRAQPGLLMPGAPPEMSDLLSAEYEDALEDFLSRAIPRSSESG